MGDTDRIGFDKSGLVVLRHFCIQKIFEIIFHGQAPQQARMTGQDLKDGQLLIKV